MKIESSGVTPSQAVLQFNTHGTTFLMDENEKLIDVTKIRKEMQERLEDVQ